MRAAKCDRDWGTFSVTHERLLETAVGLFSMKGYQGASTREIARQAGVAEVTLFRHFSSKEKLFEEVVSRYSILPPLKSFLPKALELPYEEALSAMAKILLDTLIQLKDWVTIVHAEVRRSSEKLRKVYHEFMDELFETVSSFFRELQKRGVLSDFDPEVAARAFHGIFFCYFNIEEVLMRKNHRPSDRDKAVSGFVRIFANGTSREITGANTLDR